MTEFEKILIERDGMSEEEAKLERLDAMERVENGEDPEEVLYDYGLEPDYVFDIIPDF